MVQKRTAKPKKAKAKERPPRSRWRWLRYAFYAAAILAALGAGTLVGGYLYFSRDLPDFHSLSEWRPPQTTRVFAADGTLLAELHEERRTVVPRERIADVLVQAVLSAEDADFFRHEGLDYTGMLRALYNSARAGRLTGSGSTITQQTVKNLVLTQAKTYERKAREIILARRIETRLSKDDILTLYLNAIYLGHGRYGVQEASRFYWGRDAAEVTLAQAATLAGLISSPERLSPRKHPERAKARRRFVLREMAENGYISKARQEAADRAPLALAEPPDTHLADAAWFVDAVRAQLAESLGDEVLKRGGLRVTTTLDTKRQKAAVAAVRAGLRALDERQKFGRPERTAKNAEAWIRKRAKALKGAPPRPGQVVPARVASVGPEALELDLGVGKATLPRAALARFAKDGRPGMAAGDVVKVTVRADGPRHPEVMHATLASAPQAALVAIDPQSGDVLALVGGYDHAANPFNRATQARRQTGSAFKPFVWGAAYASRRFTPATVMVDAPETWPLTKGKWWKPKNYSGKYRGPLPLSEALAHSVNSIAVRLADEVGVAEVHRFARDTGMEQPLTDNLTVALGSSELTPLELATAYATIASGGRRSRPRLVVGISGPDGPLATDLTAEPKVETTLEPAIAHVLRETMRAVVTEGSGRSLKRFPRPVAGKTGTSNEARDTWFVALLPEVVTVAWVGFDTPRSLGRGEAGSRTALPLVKRYLEAVETEGPSWPPAPEGVVTRLVDRASGKLAAPGNEGAAEVAFLTGTEPTELALAADELDAGTFVMRQTNGPSLEVPRVDVAPVPDDLLPLDGVDARPAPEPREPSVLDTGDLPDDLSPAAPVHARPATPAARDEDAP